MILSFKELSEKIGFEIDENINIQLLKEHAYLTNIFFSGPKNTFVKSGTLESEIKQLSDSFGGNHNLIVYAKRPKQPAKNYVSSANGKLIESIFTYYKVFTFPAQAEDDDFLEMKKLFKIHKLKAFL